MAAPIPGAEPSAPMLLEEGEPGVEQEDSVLLFQTPEERQEGQAHLIFHPTDGDREANPSFEDLNWFAVTLVPGVSEPGIVLQGITEVSQRVRSNLYDQTSPMTGKRSVDCSLVGRTGEVMGNTDEEVYAYAERRHRRNLDLARRKVRVTEESQSEREKYELRVGPVYEVVSENGIKYPKRVQKGRTLYLVSTIPISPDKAKERTDYYGPRGSRRVRPS